MRAIRFLLIVTIISSACYQPESNFYQFERNDNDSAEVQIFTSVKAEKPVPSFLYGKFTEHLGANVYGGAWAQILINPGFENWQFWGSDEDFERRMDRYSGWLNFPDYDIDTIMDSYRRGVAPFWVAHGQGDATYEMDSAAFNSATSQKIEVHSLESPLVGIQQYRYLPLHREQDYELSFYARSTALIKLSIAIRTTQAKGQTLANSELEIAAEDWKQYTLRLTITEPQEKGTLLALTIGLSTPGTIWLDQMALFPEDNIDGFDADVVRLSRESQLPILRFPGGNFVSGYHWKEGIGPMEKRATVRNPHWETAEYNHVGTDEHLAFCRAVGAEPLICVNAGNGTPEEAADWVEYCNGDTDTRYGALRAENGHPEPYGVVYWEIGNELYGDWQIGYTTSEGYAERYEKFYRAMTAVDPTIKVIANGADLDWNRPILEAHGGILRSLSIHITPGFGALLPPDVDPREVFESFMAYPFHYGNYLGKLRKQLAKYLDEPKLAVTELQSFINREDLPNSQSLAEALFYSGMINASIRADGLVEMITHSALVNHAGGLVKAKQIVYPNPVYYGRKLYATQSGISPVKIKIRTPMYTSTDLIRPVIPDVPYLDAVALMDAGNNELNLMLTNRHTEKALNTTVFLYDFIPAGDVRVQTLSGESYLSANSLSGPDNVKIKKSLMQIGEAADITYLLPPHSIALLVFTRAGQ